MPPEEPWEPPLDELCEPPLDGIEGIEGIEGIDDEEPPPPPDEPEEDDWLPLELLPEGIDGMLDPLLPPLDPELEELLLEEDEEPPDELGIDVGMLEEEEDCWPAHPPIRNADTVPIAVACAAMTSRRSSAGVLFIALSSGIRNAGTGMPARRRGLF